MVQLVTRFHIISKMLRSETNVYLCCMFSSRSEFSNLDRPPDKAVRSWDIMLCSWARHLTLTVPLSPRCTNGYL